MSCLLGVVVGPLLHRAGKGPGVTARLGDFRMAFLPLTRPRDLILRLWVCRLYLRSSFIPWVAKPGVEGGPFIGDFPSVLRRGHPSLSVIDILLLPQALVCFLIQQVIRFHSFGLRPIFNQSILNTYST